MRAAAGDRGDPARTGDGELVAELPVGVTFGQDPVRADEGRTVVAAALPFRSLLLWSSRVWRRPFSAVDGLVTSGSFADES
jgi:hypothetical protein